MTSLRAITYSGPETPSLIGAENRNVLFAVLGGAVVGSLVGAAMGGARNAMTGGLLMGGLAATAGGASVAWRQQNILNTYSDVVRVSGTGEDSIIQESNITLTPEQGDPDKQRWLALGTAVLGVGALSWGAARWKGRKL